MEMKERRPKDIKMQALRMLRHMFGQGKRGTRTGTSRTETISHPPQDHRNERQGRSG